MRAEDFICFDILDAQGYKTPVTATIENGCLYVSCLAKEFYSLFGDYTIKFQLGSVHPFFKTLQQDPFAKQLQEELGKIKARTIQYYN